MVGREAKASSYSISLLFISKSSAIFPWPRGKLTNHGSCKKYSGFYHSNVVLIRNLVNYKYLHEFNKFDLEKNSEKKILRYHTSCKSQDYFYWAIKKLKKVVFSKTLDIHYQRQDARFFQSKQKHQHALETSISGKKAHPSMFS